MTQRKPRHSRRSGAFTLLEVLVALAILAVGLVGVMQAVTQCIRTSRLNNERCQAVELAEQRMSELTLNTQLDPGTDTGDFGDDYPRYRWESQIEQTEQEGLYRLKVTVLWSSGDHEQAVDLESCYAPSVLVDGSAAAAGGDMTGANGTPSQADSAAAAADGIDSLIPRLGGGG